MLLRCRCGRFERRCCCRSSLVRTAANLFHDTQSRPHIGQDRTASWNAILFLNAENAVLERPPHILPLLQPSDKRRIFCFGAVDNIFSDRWRVVSRLDQLDRHDNASVTAQRLGLLACLLDFMEYVSLPMSVFFSIHRQTTEQTRK